MIKDPILKSRIEEIPEVSKAASNLFAHSLVWDMVLPMDPSMPETDDQIAKLFRRFRKVGVTFASITVATRHNAAATLNQIGRLRRLIDDESSQFVFANTVEDIKEAKKNGRLALSFHFQDTLPFEENLDLVQTYFGLGVRSAGLAYNQRNYVADGCAEESDSGLSRYGVAVVREMNNVGMVVDGTHAGYRSTMEAMEIAELPFIFSHSNPHAVRPHYRSIRDDQIRACAATGGVVGINGVGYWVGDNDASSDAIFRCLDYTVQMVGPDHVGLGFDYMGDLDAIIAWVRAAPLMWPPYEGEEMVRHNYAGPEQLYQLTELMLSAGYPNDAVRKILGDNWARLFGPLWRH